MFNVYLCNYLWHFLAISDWKLLQRKSYTSYFFPPQWWAYVIKKLLYFSEMAHRMEESIQISDVVINASGNCMRVCGYGAQGLIFTHRLCLFLWRLPDGHCRKRCPTWIFTTVGKKQILWAFTSAPLLKTVSSADRCIIIKIPRRAKVRLTRYEKNTKTECVSLNVKDGFISMEVGI